MDMIGNQETTREIMEAKHQELQRKQEHYYSERKFYYTGYITPLQQDKIETQPTITPLIPFDTMTVEP